MKRSIIFLLLIVLAFPSFCVVIDGKLWDWDSIAVFTKCSPHILSKDRAGLDMQEVKVFLGRKQLFMLIQGRSVTGQKADKGDGFKRTSIRVSFNSAQSPLNRVRAAIDPKKPYQIRISSPSGGGKDLGTYKDRYCASGRAGKNYFFELMIPIFYTSKGIHVGTVSGPLIKLAAGSKEKRNTLSSVLINSVDTKVHRLVDTCEFTIKKGEL